jgi:hypothetical protein
MLILLFYIIPVIHESWIIYAFIMLEIKDNTRKSLGSSNIIMLEK